MRYDQDFIEKVRDSNNIVDIISQYTELKGRGHQHMGLCPFPSHNEKTGSFSVSESKQLYHCFGCKKSGNIFTFLEVYNGFSFVESLEYLANKAHIPMPEPKDGEPRRGSSKEQKNQFYRANKFAAVFYHQKLKALPAGHPAKTYLKNRNFTEEMIDEFRIGYASEEWDKLHKSFLDKKVPTVIGEKLGLLRKNKNGGYFDLFRDRIMFPIFSIDEEVVGFGGRIINEGNPKYINSVESDVFKKNRTFYGIDKSVKYIRSEDRVYVVEGYMDFLALYSRGIKNVVATLGTALTENHVKLLKRWTKNVVLLFDGDQAGQTAAERSLLHFFIHNQSPQIFSLPDGQDPDDFITEHGTEAFKEKAKQGRDLFLHLLNKWMRDYKGQPKDKVQFMDKATPMLQALSDQRLVQIYAEEVGQRLSVETGQVMKWLKGQKPREMRSQEVSPRVSGAKSQKLSLEGVAKDELVLLGLSLKSLKFMDFFVNHKGVEYLVDHNIKEIFSQIVTKHGQAPENFDKLAHLVVSRVENPEKIVNLINISSDVSASEEDENVMKECFIRIKDRYLQRQASVLATEIKNEPSDEKLERIMNIQKDRIALKKIKNTPLGES